ncbi:hypothetical protein ACFL3H_10575, partial [Gemmatimonadota bacterium]
MRSSQTSTARTGGIARLRSTTFRMSWLVPVTVLLALYLGLGGWKVWGFLALVPAWLSMRSAGSSPAADPLGRWKWAFLSLAVLSAAGNILLPLRPSEQLLVERESEDRALVIEAVQTIRGHLEDALVSATEALADLSRGMGTRERLESILPELPSVIEDGVAIALFREEGVQIAWAGSPYLVPAHAFETDEWGGSAGMGPGWFFTAGDSLSAAAYSIAIVPEGTLVVAGLLARKRTHPDLASGADPILEKMLPEHIASRLRIVPDEGRRWMVMVQLGPWSEETFPYPGRGVIQIALLCSILLLSLLLLSKDNSVTRGLSAAPVIYASVVPLVLGMANRPLALDLIAPSWTGHQLINQAFLAVAGAGLALWFALGIRARLRDGVEKRFSVASGV